MKFVYPFLMPYKNVCALKSTCKPENFPHISDNNTSLPPLSLTLSSFNYSFRAFSGLCARLPLG